VGEGGWFFGATPWSTNIDTTGEAIDLFTGARDFRDPKYHEHGVPPRGVKQHGFSMRQVHSLSYYGHRPASFAGQKLAMGDIIGSRVPADKQEAQGKIGTMVMRLRPKGQDGRNGKPTSTPAEARLGKGFPRIPRTLRRSWNIWSRRKG